MKRRHLRVFRLFDMHYHLRDLVVDTARRMVTRDGQRLHLPDLSFDVLVELIQAAPDPVSATQFASAVWHTQHVSDETVAQRITLLRKALSDDPRKPEYIRTVRGKGYALMCPVRRHDAETSVSIERGRLRPTWIAAAMATTLLVGLFAIKAHRDREPSIVVATQQSPSDSAILVQRARAQLRLHQSRETNRAISMLGEALAQAPGDYDARLTLSFALTTRATKFGGGEADKYRSEAIARALIAERPENSNAWSALGYVLDARGRAEEALPAYQTAYRLDPGNVAALSSAAYTMMIHGDLYQALALEVRARQSGNTSRYSEIQIAQLLELIEHPAADAWRARAQTLNPGHVVVTGELARSHLRRGDWQAALDVLDRLEGEERQAPAVLQLRGRIAVARGEWIQARRFFERAGPRGELDLAALDALRGDGTVAENVVLHKLGQLENSSWPGFRVHIAEVQASLGRRDDALALIQQAINLGWRDLHWLKQSPFLRDTMASAEGQRVEARIRRALDAQRRLILSANELAHVFDG